MAEIRAVLFDWRGTVVVDWADEWWIRRAFEVIGEPFQDGDVAPVAEALDRARRGAEISALLATQDRSAGQHRMANLAWFDAAGLEPDFAAALYELDFDPSCHPFASDAASTLRALKAEGLQLAVVSNIHFDLRPEFAERGLSKMVDEFVLSFEVGVCKPDPTIFHLALEALGARPEETLMIGDRPDADGGAVSLGISTLLVPTLRRPDQERLHLVLGLTGAAQRPDVVSMGDGAVDRSGPPRSIDD